MTNENTNGTVTLPTLDEAMAKVFDYMNHIEAAERSATNLRKELSEWLNTVKDVTKNAQFTYDGCTWQIRSRKDSGNFICKMTKKPGKKARSAEVLEEATVIEVNVDPIVVE